MSTHTLTLAAGLAAAALAISGCTTTQHRNAMAERAAMDGSARFCAESGQMFRMYRYFPNNEVYQSVHHYRWFWQDGDNTFSSQTRPESLEVDPNFYVLIELPTTRPFAMHTTVTAQYPSTATLMAINSILHDEVMAQNTRTSFNADDATYVSAPTDH